MWSDPDDIENWAVSPRGAGWLFGGNVTQEASNDSSLISVLFTETDDLEVQPCELAITHSSSSPAGPDRVQIYVR